MRKVIAVCLIGALLVWITACAEWSRTQKGAAIGTASGAAAGAVVGKLAGSTLIGALIGAAVGGGAGAYIGHYMDKEAAEIERDIEGAKVERIGEGIKITFDSGVLFDVGKATLQEGYKTELAQLATILNKYPDTNILLEGHTDSTGSEEFNLGLSKNRAQAVADFLATQNVAPPRFTVMGYGSSQPVAGNDTKEGRAQNRRVEVAIFANEKLKKVAKEKAT